MLEYFLVLMLFANKYFLFQCYLDFISPRSRRFSQKTIFTIIQHYIFNFFFYFLFSQVLVLISWCLFLRSFLLACFSRKVRKVKNAEVAESELLLFTLNLNSSLSTLPSSLFSIF